MCLNFIFYNDKLTIKILNLEFKDVILIIIYHSKLNSIRNFPQ